MCKWIKIYVVLIFILPKSFAGDFLGNGGGGIECHDQPLQLLDFYEMEHSGIGQPDLHFKNMTAQQMADLYINRLRHHSPARANMYSDKFSQFYNKATFVDDLPLMDIPDLGVEIPLNCKWRQIVNQNPLLLEPGKEYLIDQNLWTRLSITHQIGLIFHEIIYGESKSENSKGLRYLNGLIAVDQLNQKNLAERISIFQKAGLTWMEAQGVQFHLTQDLDFSADKLFRATPVDRSLFKWHEQILNLRSDPIRFFTNGKLQSLRIYNELLIQFDNKTLRIYTWQHSDDKIEFHENGNFKRGHLTRDTVWSFQNDQCDIKYTSIELDNQGYLQILGGANGSVRINEKDFLIQNQTDINFYKNERVQSFFWGSQDNAIVNNQIIYPKYGHIVQLNSKGQIKQFVSRQSGRLQKPNGEWIQFTAGEKVDIE